MLGGRRRALGGFLCAMQKLRGLGWRRIKQIGMKKFLLLNAMPKRLQVSGQWMDDDIL